MNQRRPAWGPWLGLAVLVLVFARDLRAWIQYGLNSDLYSYTLLVPALVAVVICPRWFILLPGIVWMAIILILGGGSSAPALDYVRLYACATLVIVLLAGWRGRTWLASHLFPLALLYLAVPLPAVAEHAANQLLQQGSAILADLLFQMSGVPSYRSGFSLALPGLDLVVTESCSGIRSTLVLLLVAAAGGYLLLVHPLHRLLMVALVIPLGMLRNAIRIFTLGWLTVQVDPGFIRSSLHRRGGPLFFLFALGLLLALFVLLRRRETRFEKECMHEG